MNVTTCVVDLWDLCPIHNVTHHQQVVTADTADYWFPSPSNPIVTTQPSPQGTESEPVMDYDFTDQILTHAYVEARALADGKVPVFDNSVID